MPFPFDLAGPAFLLVYVVTAAVALAIAAFVVFRGENAAGDPRQLPTDPYEIAYLRGGPAEAVKVAVLALIDRGLIRHKQNAQGGTVLRAARNARTGSGHPLEREVMARVASPTPAESLAGPALAQAATRLVAPPLAARGLIVAGPAWTRRVRILGSAWGALTLLFAVRMAQALANQRGNVWFLVILWLVAGAAAWAIARRLPHAGATRALGALETLLADLRARVAQLRPGRATNELALLAAVFGLVAVPQALAPYAWDLGLALTPAPPRKSDGGGGDSSSSGCGGGGGGGGGGGCGGCGGG